MAQALEDELNTLLADESCRSYELFQQLFGSVFATVDGEPSWVSVLSGWEVRQLRRWYSLLQVSRKSFNGPKPSELVNL